MKTRNVQAAHEIRMWLVLIVGGVIAAKKYVSEHPDAEAWVNERVNRVTSKFKKEEPNREKIIKVVVVHED